jgi:hypothetical protein
VTINKELESKDAFAGQLLVRSQVVAMALAQLHRVWPFDLAEFPDYGGYAFDTLKSSAYIPETVVIAVRVFGSLQLYDRGESLNVPISERRLVYVNEQISLLTADLLICPSDSCRDLMSPTYGIPRTEILVAKVVPSLLPLFASSNNVPDAQRAVSPNKQVFARSDKNQEFLIYGDLDVNALASTYLPTLFELVRNQGSVYRRLHFHITPCPSFAGSSQSLSQLIDGIIAPNYASYFSFDCSIDADTMVRLSRIAAVIFLPSPTMNINIPAFAHHVASQGVPMIMPTTPSFTSEFSTSNGLFYPLPELNTFISSNDEAVLDAKELTESILTILGNWTPSLPVTPQKKSDVDLSVYRFYSTETRRRHENLRADFLMAKRAELKERMSRK